LRFHECLGSGSPNYLAVFPRPLDLSLHHEILGLLIAQLDIQGIQHFAIVHPRTFLVVGVRISMGEIHIFYVQDIGHVGLQVQVIDIFLFLRDRLIWRLRDLAGA
jgi:hypothetical protein